MTRREARSPLMVTVWAELGAGRMTETFIKDPHWNVDGENGPSGHIYVNPAYGVCNTVVHEILHRLHPAWSERYVRNRTSFLLHRMTEDEIERFYEEYQRRVTKRKAKRV